MTARPQPDEYQPYAETYVSQVPHDKDVLTVLAESLKNTYELFIGIDSEKAMYAYAPNKWTIKEVLGHMIDTERVFAFRAFCFSREDAVLPGFDQDVYVNNTDYNSRSIQDLAEEFRVTRLSNLYMFKSLTDAQLTKRGTANGFAVSVRALLFCAAGHELHHLKILKELYL